MAGKMSPFLKNMKPQAKPTKPGILNSPTDEEAMLDPNEASELSALDSGDAGGGTPADPSAASAPPAVGSEQVDAATATPTASKVNLNVISTDELEMELAKRRQSKGKLGGVSGGMGMKPAIPQAEVLDQF